jgi:hypothetical protein
MKLKLAGALGLPAFFGPAQKIAHTGALAPE